MLAGMTEHTPILDPEQFEVLGADMQVLNLKISGDECVTSAPGAMMYMEPSISMSTNCNDCLGRRASGSPCIMSEYKNDGSSPAVVGLTPAIPAKVISLQLEGKTFRCKNGAFFASKGDVDISFNLDCNPLTCCFGGQGCVRQTVGGTGTAFLQAMGTIMTKELGPGEKLVVDTDSVVAWSDSIELSIRRAGGCCTCCCGGEGAFNTVLSGPGVVYIQSMSWKKFKTALTMSVEQQQKEAQESEGGGPPTADGMER